MSYQPIPKPEREYIRDLAKRQLEIANLPLMKKRAADWYNHNDLKGERPMVIFETITCLQEFVQLLNLKCENPLARQIEQQISLDILRFELINDDTVVNDFFGLLSFAWLPSIELFSTPVKHKSAKDLSGKQLGHQFIYPIKDLKEDFDIVLRPSKYTFHKEAPLKQKAVIEDIIGDILPVKILLSPPGCTLTQKILHLMGMENMMLSMMDYPELFHKLMERTTEDYITFYNLLEREGVLVLNNNNTSVGNGSFGFTNDLPGRSYTPGSRVRLKDVWCTMDSQETVNISPDLFGEFIYPYYSKIAVLFGLVSYGCCEPVHPYWEKYIENLPNLRKVSVSSWCDEEYMGDRLRASDVIYHRKPSPTFIGVKKEFDEEAFAEHIRKTLKCAKGCKLEFTIRDVYTLNGDIRKPGKAVGIIRNLIEESWV